MSLTATSTPSVRPRRWLRRGLWGLGLLGALLALAVWLGLDPWLRRTLEKQVAQQTHGQYRLTIGSLHTRLLPRALHLRGLDLRPTAASLADTLPRLRLRLARLDLSGVGLLALLRGQTVPLDSLVLDSLHLRVEALARRPAPHPGPPLYQRLPVRLGYAALRHASGSFGPAGAPVGALAAADVVARDVLFTPAGAADSARLGFAAAWRATLHGPTGLLGGHYLGARLVYFSSQEQVLRLDSMRIAPPKPGQGKPGAVRVAMALPHLVVRGLRAATWQHRHRLVADSARLTGPRLTFRPPAQAPPPLWQLLAPLTKRTDLGRLTIADGYLAVAGLRHRPVVRHVYAEARAIRVDSAAGQAGARRIVYARVWKGHTGRLSAVFDAPIYPTTVERLVVDTDAHLLQINRLLVRPVLTAAQLNLRKGYQLSRLTVRLGVARAQDFDFSTLSDRSEVHIARLVVEQPWLQVGSDGRGPLNPHISIMTPEALRKLKAVVDVRRVDVRDGTIATSYRSTSTPLVGTFNVTRFNATLHNFSNDPRRQSFQHPLTGTATAYLQDRCRMELHLSAPMLDPQGRHRLWGSFGPAPFSILNPITRPTRLLAFKSGAVQRIRFVLNVSRQQAAGQVWAEYIGLKFDLLKYKEGAVKKTLWSRVKSGLVNGLVIRDNNPRPGGRLVVGDMDVRRDLRASVFTVWRQGLIRGVLHSAGVPGPLAQKLSQQSDQGPLPGRK